jgi:hypothetical protein
MGCQRACAFQSHCCWCLMLLQMPLDDIQSLMDETAEAKEYQVSSGRHRVWEWVLLAMRYQAAHPVEPAEGTCS